MRLFRMRRARCLRRWTAGKCLVAGAEANPRPLVWSPGDDRGGLSVGRRKEMGDATAGLKTKITARSCARRYRMLVMIWRDRFEAGRGMSPSRPSFDKPSRNRTKNKGSDLVLTCKADAQTRPKPQTMALEKRKKGSGEWKWLTSQRRQPRVFWPSDGLVCPLVNSSGSCQGVKGGVALPWSAMLW